MSCSFSCESVVGKEYGQRRKQDCLRLGASGGLMGVEADTLMKLSRVY